MTAETNDISTSKTFELTCTDCTFETTVDGSFYDALDVADAHQEEHGVAPTDHFVNFQLDGHV